MLRCLLAFLLLVTVIACSGPEPRSDQTPTDGGELDTCSDGLLSDGEEGLDCGGVCPACKEPALCDGDEDCASGTCLEGRCVEDSKCARQDGTLAFECDCQSPDQCSSGQCTDGHCDAMQVANDSLPDPSNLGDYLGERFAFDCPPNAPQGNVWGTDVYTLDSNICTAGVHAGRFTREDGGRVVIEIWPGRDSYLSSTRHGVSSSSWGSYYRSFIVFPAGACLDGQKNGEETDVDCGGGCGACDTGRTCGDDEDCASGFCNDGVCDPPLCSNGRQDEGESDVDCGGDCSRCDLGQRCGGANDCGFDTDCRDGVCAVPFCLDGIQGQHETDIDCGGADCTSCRGGQSCLVGTDCRSGRCDDGECAVPGCSNDVKDGLETGIDCGGPVCSPCPLDEGCAVGADCESRTCSQGACVTTGACVNGVQYGDESDVDCGDGCLPCRGGLSCVDQDDCDGREGCESNVCAIPVADTQTRLEFSQREPGRRWTYLCPAELATSFVWGVDVFTGDSSICTAAVHAGLHALSTGGVVTIESRRGQAAYAGSTANGVTTRSYGSYSNSYAFVPPGPCANGVRDGSETDVDCGGDTCAKCSVGARCDGGDDCAGGLCVDGHCAD